MLNFKYADAAQDVTAHYIACSTLWAAIGLAKDDPIVQCGLAPIQKTNRNRVAHAFYVYHAIKHGAAELPFVNRLTAARRIARVACS